MQGLQRNKLFHQQNKSSGGKACDEEILQKMQKTHRAQRNEEIIHQSITRTASMFNRGVAPTVERLFPKQKVCEFESHHPCQSQQRAL